MVGDIDQISGPHEEISQYFDLVKQTISDIDGNSLIKFSDSIYSAIMDKKQIIAFGNGGSGATASHFVGDLIKGVSYQRSTRAKAICLNDNSPALLAIANDVSYNDIFLEQLKNYISPGDIVVGFSGSGNSENVVKAIKYGKEIGAKTVAICGYKGGKISKIADLVIHANVNDMEVSEDLHLLITHCVKNMVIRRLDRDQLRIDFSGSTPKSRSVEL